MKMIVGLGNPGRRYAQTRHNVGFRVVDRLAEAWGERFQRKLLVSAETARARPDELGAALLVKPRTYMNNSGAAVAPLMRRNGLKPADVVVVVDDVDLPLGRLRVRPGGSSGGHNGLKSIIAALGTDAFARVRVGVGRGEGPQTDTARHVLSAVSPADRPAFEQAVARAAEAVVCLLREGPETAMNRFNASME